MRSLGIEYLRKDTRSVLSANDQSLLSQIRTRQRAALRSALGAQSLADTRGLPCALVDFPFHVNPGDTLIWRGEKTLLDEFGMKLNYVSDMRSFDLRALQEFAPEGPIFLHGGGNLGDLWPGHQAFREHLLEKLPHRDFILLPQTAHFSDAQNEDRAVRAFAAHNNVTVMLRDPQSMKWAAERLVTTPRVYCPDLGLAVDLHRAPDISAGAEMVAILRTDLERAEANGAALPPTVTTMDWGFRGGARVDWMVRSRAVKVSSRAWWRSAYAQRFLRSQFDRISTTNIAAATRLLCSGRVVITDRMHAHIMCCLLNIPHVVLDNSYGKTSGVYDAYSGQFSTAHFANDLTDALQTASELSVKCQTLLLSES